MFKAYRIRPVVETQGPELGELLTCEAFDSLAAAQAEIAAFESRSSFSGVEGKRIIWTLYGVNPMENGVRTEDAIADRETEQDCRELLGNLIGRFATVGDGARDYFFPVRPAPAPIMSSRTFNNRETNTILHALRSMAQNARDDIRDACHDACDHSIDAPMLDSVAIDALCESIGLDSLGSELCECGRKKQDCIAFENGDDFQHGDRN